jgi:hypothetical protein
MGVGRHKFFLQLIYSNASRGRGSFYGEHACAQPCQRFDRSTTLHVRANIETAAREKNRSAKYQLLSRLIPAIHENRTNDCTKVPPYEFGGRRFGPTVMLKIRIFFLPTRNPSQISIGGPGAAILVDSFWQHLCNPAMKSPFSCHLTILIQFQTNPWI